MSDASHLRSTQPTTEAESDYIPIGERVQQDVWHDNFVPKYSGLASVRPSRLILVGVWMIFLPMALMGVFGLLAAYALAMQQPRQAASLVLIQAIFGIGTLALSLAILWHQTRRYCEYVEPLDE